MPTYRAKICKLEEIVAKWKNRPLSASAGERISHPHAKHMLDGRWAALTFVDESPNWKWSLLAATAPSPSATG